MHTPSSQHFLCPVYSLETWRRSAHRHLFWQNTGNNSHVVVDCVSTPWHRRTIRYCSAVKINAAQGHARAWVGKNARQIKNKNYKIACCPEKPFNLMHEVQECASLSNKFEAYERDAKLRRK